MSGAGRRRIVSVEVEPLDLELTEPFGIATGAQELARNALVRVQLESGLVGLGEAAPFPAVTGETQGGTIAAIRELAPLLIGRDAAELRPMARALKERMANEAAARSALEQAMFDAVAQSAGVSLSHWFGGARQPLETDLTITTGDVAHARESAEGALRRGIRAIKLKIGAGNYREDLDRLEAVREIAPDVTLTVDANGGYSVTDAISFARECTTRTLGVALFEQPTPRDPLRPAGAIREVTHALRALEPRMLVCADEAAKSIEDVVAIIRNDAADAVNLKITKSSVVETIAMWHVARAAGLSIMIGGMVEAELAMTFSAHLASGLGEISFVDLDTPLFLKSTPFSGGFTLEGGAIRLDTTRPGCGVFVATDGA
jgi:L-alanine-DL-glutamate epimerase-like enolase superfamily enzyme